MFKVPNAEQINVQPFGAFPRQKMTNGGKLKENKDNFKLIQKPINFFHFHDVAGSFSMRRSPKFSKFEFSI